MTLHELEEIMLRDVNLRHATVRPGDRDLQARIASFDVARGMMHEAPEALDTCRETKATLACYGIKEGDTTSFGYQCLIARRLIERGVRVVELIDSGPTTTGMRTATCETIAPKRGQSTAPSPVF